jgi:hypothetical protein
MYLFCLSSSLSKAGLTSDGRSSALSYVVGLVMYAGQFPFVLPLRSLPWVLTPHRESIKPNRFFDYVAHSHQFWHIAILVAIYVQWQAITFMHREGTSRDPLGPHKALSALTTERHAFSAPASGPNSRPWVLRVHPNHSCEHVCCRCV